MSWFTRFIGVDNAVASTVKKTLQESYPFLPGTPANGSLDWHSFRPDADGFLPTGLYRNRSKTGDNPQAYLHDEDLRRAREQSRDLSCSNEYARNGLMNRRNYIVGTGFKTAAESVNPDAPNEALVKQVNEWLARYAAITKRCEKEKESVMRGDRDGETFIRLFKEDGLLQWRFVEPEHVGNFDGQTPFGIKTNPKDITKVLHYLVRYEDGGTVEEVPADEMIHIKLNTDSGIKRGLPFLYPVFGILKKIESTNMNMATNVAIMASIAMIRRRQFELQTTVDTSNSTSADMQTTNPFNRGASVDNYKVFRPGTILDVDAQTEYEFPANGINLKGVVDVKQSLLQTAAAGMGLPEYMLTSDASNGNFACHDSQTELLTKRGWLKYHDLLPTDIAGTMNPDSGEFEWQSLDAIHVHDYSGEMVKLSGSHNLDLLVTPNHRMYVSQDQHRRIDGKLVRQGLKPWRFVRADELQGGEILPFACKAKTQGVPVECVVIDGEKLADQVHSLAVQGGYVSNLRMRPSGIKTITLRPSERNLRVRSHQIARVNYTGKVWCATVKNGLLVTRRNGKSIITGNSTQVAETPAIAGFLAMQHFWADIFGSGPFVEGADNGLTWRAIQMAVDERVLPAEVLTEIRLSTEGPSIEVRDKAAETQRNQSLADAGIISRDKWAKKEGEHKAHKSDEEVQAAKQAEMQATQQHELAMAGAKSSKLNEQFDEDLHPRDGDGKFANKGGEGEKGVDDAATNGYKFQDLTPGSYRPSNTMDAYKDAWNYRKGGFHDVTFHVGQHKDNAGVTHSMPIEAAMLKISNSYINEMPDGKEKSLLSSIATRGNGVEFQFSNIRTQYGDGQGSEEGGYGATGTGHAKEIISKAAGLLIGYVERFNPEIVYYTAEGKSRASLYDFLTKRASKHVDYTPLKLSIDGYDGAYALVHNDHLSDYKDLLGTHKIESAKMA